MELIIVSCEATKKDGTNIVKAKLQDPLGMLELIYRFFTVKNYQKEEKIKVDMDIYEVVHREFEVDGEVRQAKYLQVKSQEKKVIKKQGE